MPQSDKCSHGKDWTTPCLQCELISLKEFVGRWDQLVIDAKARIAELEPPTASAQQDEREAFEDWFSDLPIEWTFDSKSRAIAQAAWDASRAAQQVQADAGAVGEAVTMPGTDGFTMACFEASKVPVGTNLYAHPSPAGAVTPTDAEVFAEMTAKIPRWNDAPRSRESAVRLALESYRHLAAMSREQSGGGE